MLEHGFDGFVIGEDEPKRNFRVTVFEDLIQFFPHVIARKSIERETYIMNGRFFRVGGRVRVGREHLV